LPGKLFLGNDVPEGGVEMLGIFSLFADPLRMHALNCAMRPAAGFFALRVVRDLLPDIAKLTRELCQEGKARNDKDLNMCELLMGRIGLE
jgi:hypothetical protein